VLEETSRSTCQLTGRRVGLDEFTGYLPHVSGQAENVLQHPNSKLETHSKRQKQQLQEGRKRENASAISAGASNLLSKLPKLDSVLS